MLRVDQKILTSKDIETWLVAHVANAMKIAAAEIDPRQTFEYYGLGSLEGASMIGDLENWLGRALDATLVWDYPSIALLARHLAGEQKQ